MERKWRQSTAKRTISGAAFTQGVIDFDFSVGSNTVFIPSKSYFRIGVQLESLNGAGGAPQAMTGRELAFANFCPGNMFDNCFFYAGGQNVSSCINYSPQAHALSYRLRKSGAWLNSVGKDAYGIAASYHLRKRLVDETVVADADVALAPSQDGGDAPIRYFIYQPPLGIMEHSKPMGAGQYRFQFNPASNYATACVESDDAATHFRFTVESMELYVCEEKMDISPTGTDVLHLLEHQVQSKKMDNPSLDFTVPPSTKAITIFVQSGVAGTDIRIPPSKFTTLTDTHVTLQNLQLTYANTTKPPTNWSSDSGAHILKLQQRYLDTQIESGQAFSSGGCETMADWLLNGPIYHYTFVRDANDRSTQVQLSTQWKLPVNAADNLFLVAHYTRSVEIQVEAGYISSVVSLNL